jgi:hypothetical protein
MKAATVPHQRTRGERAEAQCLQVDLMNEFRIGGEQELKPAVQPKTIYMVGADPSAWRIFRLQQFDRQTSLFQMHGATQAG